MTPVIFVTDIHGSTDRYEKLFQLIRREKPKAVFMGGDLFPAGIRKFSSLDFQHQDFINDYLAANLQRIKNELQENYPELFLIMGNDDARIEEAAILDVATRGLWRYAHQRRLKLGNYIVIGYNYVPPTPFQLKDWERYDVSRYVDPGCISPEEGIRTMPIEEHVTRYATMKADIESLTKEIDLKKAVMLFHSPPYKTNLDRAALDGKMIDHVPLDVHVGSIAIERFIKTKQPYITMHGHIHESTRLTGSWKEKIGNTFAFNAAHDGKELSVIKLNLEEPVRAERVLI